LTAHTDSAPAAATALGFAERRRVVLAVAIGSTVEFYDFGVYGYLAITLGGLFFSESSPTAGLLASLAVFGVAYVARPVGGIIFGQIGDRLGRKPALTLSVILMALMTCAIGLLPDFSRIGIAAPILLVVARLAQGLAAGGEAAGAASMLAESSLDHRRGFMTSATQVGTLLGLLLASGVVALTNMAVGAEAMAQWGWRLPFLLALPTGLVGLYIRRRLEETADFRGVVLAGEVTQLPIAAVFRSHLSAVLKSTGLCVMTFAGFYIVFVYLAIYLQTAGRFDRSVATWSTTGTLLVAALALPAFGLLSDRIGRRRLFAGTAVAFLIVTLPVFQMMQSGSIPIAVTGQILLGLCASAAMAPLWATLAEMFPTRVRCSGMGVAFNVAAALVGGTAPYVAAWLTATTGDASAPGYFLMAAALVTLGTLLTVRETSGGRLPV